MSDLLIYFALPVATVILSVVLQKLLRSPILVAATAFAIYLIVTFAAFDESFLLFAIVYTILAYLTALLTRFICCLIRNNTNSCLNPCSNANTNGNGNGNGNDDDDEDDDNNTNGCGCGCNRNNRGLQLRNNRFSRR